MHIIRPRLIGLLSGSGSSRGALPNGLVGGAVFQRKKGSKTAPVPPEEPSQTHPKSYLCTYETNLQYYEC